MNKNKTTNIFTYALKNCEFLGGRKSAVARGFTLIELMVSSAVLVMLVASAFGLFSSGSRLWGVSSAQMDLSSTGRTALDKMFEELSQAGLSTLSVSGGNDIITFKTPSAYAGGIVTWGNNIRYSVGGLNGQQLLRTDMGTAAVQTWGNNITLLRFTQPNADTISIQMTLSKQSVKGDILTVQLGSQVKLRNK
jgi:prepilin-type N-terminal cleavage/methylation domain-containing protein